MVFKRRDKRSWLQMTQHFLWPRGGWGRAAQYVRHRVRRLPDPPHRIARGIFIGIFVTFSPFFGMHFFISIFLSLLLRANIVASLMATFVGNPLTFLPIGVMSLQTGNFLLGRVGVDEEVHRSLGGKFLDASADLKHNFRAIFTHEDADWHNLYIFYDDIFFPYMIGGIIPGILFGLLGYYLSLPVIQAYQKRRTGRLKAKWDALKEKKRLKADAKPEQD